MFPRISVVIPTYNRFTTVGKAIDSVLSQTYCDVEVIVVDDGSSDDTAKVIGDAYGERIRLFKQRNQGASAARNRGIAEARGEWIAFLDSDDFWEKDKLEWQVKALERYGGQYGGCYTDVRFFNHPETRTMFELAQRSYCHRGEMGTNEDVLRLVVRPGGAGMIVCLSSFVGRAALIRETGFNPDLPYSQDSDFLFRLAMRTGFCYVNRPLVRFDRSPAELRHVGVSAEWNRMDFFLRDSQDRLEGLLRLSDGLPEDVRSVLRERLRTVHSGWANWYMEAGQYDKARSAISRAARLDLTLNVAVKWLLIRLNPRLALRLTRHHKCAKEPVGIV